MTEITDTSLTFAWDDNTAKEYLLYLAGEDKPRRFNTNTAVVSGLTKGTFYSASVSGLNGFLEGELSSIVTQKTWYPAPKINSFKIGEAYVNGEADNAPNITNCRLYRKGETVALLTGTVVAGDLKIYVQSNVNIIVGHQYDVRVIDGNPNSPSSIAGMITTFTVELPRLELNPVTSSAKTIAGTTEPNGSVRINVDNVARTVVTAGADGKFSTVANSVASNSLVKVEAKSGSLYPKSIALRADSGKTSLPAAPERTLLGLESFTTTSAWSLQSSAGTARVADTINTKDTQSIKLTADKVIAFMRNNTLNLDIKEATALEFMLYVHDAATLDKAIVYLANDTALANNVSFTINSYELTTGWNKVSVAIASGKVTGTFTKAQTVKAMQVRIEPKTDAKAEVSFDLVSSVKANKANVLFIFDDAWKEAASGIATLESKSMLANVGVVEVNESDARFMTNVELKALNLKGHDLANHTKDHPHLNTLSKADQRTQFDSCKTYLTTNNWTRANDSVIYPYGDYNADTLTALAEGGYKLGRPLTSGIEVNNPAGNYLVRTYNLTPDRTIAMAKSTVDYAIATGGTLLFLNHRLGTTEQTTDTMFWRSDWFDQLATYVKQKSDEGAVNVITASEWLLQ
ncbi:polysaccharide deacetylase family protein [Listeria booriae]|nr:polysaccharide deacetylase family protein [Listeria booriae]MBC2318785.1 polysaccharide deacetylase family protein [Listeria booriae]